MAITSLLKSDLFRTLLANSTTIPLAIVTLLLSFYIFPALVDPLRSVPGPFLARFTRLWEYLQVQKNNWEQINIELHRKYGPVVRIAPGRYSINDAIAAKKIYGHGTKFTKGNFYHAFGHRPGRENDNLFNDQNEQRHAQNRRKVANLFSMSALVTYEPHVDKCTSILLSKFEKFAASSQIIDLPTWTQFYAFDVIGEITFSKSFDMMEKAIDHLNILIPIDWINVFGCQAGLFPEWTVLFQILTVIWYGKQVDFSTVVNFVSQQVERVKSGEKGKVPDFVTKMVDMKNQGKEGIDDEIIWASGSINVAAGSDTTGLSLAATIYYLEKNPRCKAALREETDRLAAEGKISDTVTFKEAQEMPYLQAVIKEALRMHPAIGAPLPRRVPKGGAELCGYYFPEGTDVGINPWVLHRNESLFGKDANEYRPERWLEGSKEDVALMNENFFAFGAGSRTCIGKNVSLLEMTKVIPQLYRQFEFEVLDKEWKTHNRFFVKQSYNCRIKPRA